jgi:predicted  nucleic acid-binding Zn-ribbon protein
MELTLQALEGKLSDIKRYLPKPSKKRGLLNVGGGALKLLFVTVTDGDVEQLHETIHRLKERQDHVSHALEQQMSYFKHLDDSTTLNHQAIANLSSILRTHALKTQHTFQEIKTKFDWSEHQREVATITQELEFALISLNLKLDGATAGCAVRPSWENARKSGHP